MINHAHAQHGRQAERAGESKRMEERQDAQETIPAIQSENLFELLDVRADVVVAQHHAFRLAGAAAGKNHRGQIVQPGFLFRAQQLLQPAVGHEPRDEEGGELFADAERQTTACLHRLESRLRRFGG